MNLFSLLGVVFASGTLTIGTPQFRNNDTYQDVEVTTTYEYETNEVNSADDLTLNNLYKVDIKGMLNAVYNHTYNNSDGGLVLTLLLDDINDCVIDLSMFVLDDAYIDSGTYCNFGFFVDRNYKMQVTYSICVFNFCSDYTCDDDDLYNTYIEYGTYDYVYALLTGIDSSGDSSVYYSYFSESDYLGEATTTITPIETSGLYNIFYQFLNDRIFTGGYMDSMTSSVLGQTLTLGNWCSISTSIVCLALVLFVFIKLLIFLFKVVGGLFLWR